MTCERYERLDVEHAPARAAPARAACEAEVLGSAPEDQVPAPSPGEPAPLPGEPALSPGEPGPVAADLHHVALPEIPIGPASVPPDGPAVVTRLRPEPAISSTTRTSGVPEEWTFDRVMDQRPECQPDVAYVSAINRGDPGEGRVGQTLEGARIHGLEVLHEPTMAVVEPIDHLAVCPNGIWVVKSVAALSGRLERRDGGDWFTADPRLHIGGVDRSHLVAVVRRQVEAVSAVASDAGFSDVPVRGVLCFGSVNPAWVNEPFVIDGISVTWRARVVDPMLGPALIDTRTRASLVQTLAGVAPAGRAEAERQTDASRTIAG